MLLFEEVSRSAASHSWLNEPSMQVGSYVVTGNQRHGALVIKGKFKHFVSFVLRLDSLVACLLVGVFNLRRTAGRYR